MARQKEVEPDPEPAWTPQRFVESFVSERPRQKQLIIDKATTAGLSLREATKFIRLSLDEKLTHEWEFPKDRAVY